MVRGNDPGKLPAWLSSTTEIVTKAAVQLCAYRAYHMHPTSGAGKQVQRPGLLERPLDKGSARRRNNMVGMTRRQVCCSWARYLDLGCCPGYVFQKGARLNVAGFEVLITRKEFGMQPISCGQDQLGQNSHFFSTFSNKDLPAKYLHHCTALFFFSEK